MVPVLVLLACSTPAPPPAAAPPPEPAPAAAPDPLRDPAIKPPIVEGPNRPPIIKKLGILPEKPTAFDTLAVDVSVYDAEGVTVDLDYQWFVNGVEVLGFTQFELPPGHTKPGDKVHVHLVTSDGKAQDEGDSPAITIQNQAPRMLTEPRQLTRLDGFKMSCEDPEREALTWSVSGAPAGLTISDNGVLSYRGTTTEPGGAYTVTIRCDDPHGGWARIDVPISLSPGSDAAKAGK